MSAENKKWLSFQTLFQNNHNNISCNKKNQMYLTHKHTLGYKKTLSIVTTMEGLVWWHMPIILVTEIGRIKVWDQPRQKFLETQSQLMAECGGAHCHFIQATWDSISKITKAKRDGAWLTWQSICLARTRPWLQIPEQRVIFFFSTRAWTQGLHLKPLHQPFFVMVFFKIGSCELSAQAGFEPQASWSLPPE
jgi:hypothetical protein